MKKSRFLRKLVSVFLAGTMILNGVTASGETTSFNEQTTISSLDTYLNETLPERVEAINKTRSSASVQEAIREYVDEVLPYYLSNRGYYGTYITTDIIRQINWSGVSSDKYVVVISDGNKMIGTLSVEYTGTSIISAFREMNIPELFSAITSQTPFQLGYSNGCYMLYANNSFTIISNPDYVDTDFLSNINIDSLCYVNASFCESVNSAVQARVSSYFTSPVAPVVSNATSPDDGEGLCWAACVASMVMQAGVATNLMALGVYNVCKVTNYSGKPNGTGDEYPHGSVGWIMYAFSIYHMSMTRVNYGLSANQIINKISNNKPIYCSLDRDNGGHAMVLYGCNYISSTSAQYIFMDPAFSSSGGTVLSIMVGSNVMEDGTKLTITSNNTHTYTSWTKSIYS